LAEKKVVKRGEHLVGQWVVLMVVQMDGKMVERTVG
jgi:hypothetical protein